MAWYDDLINRTKEIANRNTSVSTAANSNTSTIPSSQLSNYDTSLDTSGLTKPNTDLTGSITGIDNAGRGITKQDIVDFNAIRPENKYEPQLDTAISGLKSYVDGTSQVDKTIANSYLGKFDASQAAAAMAQGQRIASNPNLSQSAKTAGLMEVQRVGGDQRSQLVGDLAQASQERAYTASQKLTDVLLNAANYKEDQFRTALEVIGNDLNRDLQAKMAVGEMTKSQAAMDLDKYRIDLDKLVSDRQAEMNRLSALDNYELASQGLGIEKEKIAMSKEEFEANLQLKQVELQNSKISMWQTTAANAILEAKNTNPDFSVEDAMNDPYTYQALTNTYKAITGTDNPPSEAWIQSFMSKVKTESEATKELDDATYSRLRESLINSGISEESADEAIGWLDTFYKSGGMLKANSDGTVSLLGVDGEPIETVGGGDSMVDKTPDEIQESMTDLFNSDKINDFITNINDGGIPSFNAFTDILKNELGDEYDPTDNNLYDASKAFFNSVKNGDIELDETTDDKWDAFSKEADKYNISIDRTQWEKDEMPSIETYKTGTGALDAISVESYSELLGKKNSTQLFDALKSNPKEVRNSEYFYEIPYMLGKATKTATSAGVRKTRLDSDIKAEFEENIGKIIDVKASNGKTITGQFMQVSETPANIQVQLKLPDGSYKDVVIFPVNKATGLPIE